MSIAQSILDIVREEMAKYNVENLEAINVAVGALSAVVPASLTFCWQVLTDRTDMETVRLNVREVPLGYRCFDCGAEFTAETMTFACPQCGADGPMLTSGRDMTIESIEVAEQV
ncbi:MAG: hydrogenase maturation nickel metallochaperone HypA [Thermodesulfobacteriota bacterium]